MSLIHLVGTGLFAGVLSALASPVPPDELLIDRIDGYRATAILADLDVDGLATVRPSALAHLDDDSPERDEVLAAVRTWVADGADITFELIRSGDAEAAQAVVDQAAAAAVALGLAAADPAFAGAWTYRGPVDAVGFVITSWNQGAYSVTVTVRSNGTIDAMTDDAVVDAMTRQVERIGERTGATVTADDDTGDDTGDAGDADHSGDTGGSAAGPPGAIWYGVVLAAAFGAAVFVRRVRRGTP
jgi:hypothetical protein